MTEARHVRFYISELIAALEAYGKLRRPSVSEAMTFYYNWAMARGWRLVSVLGRGHRKQIWTGCGDRSTQLEVQERDNHYEVVWAGDTTDGTCDFIEAFPVIQDVRDVIEILEIRGWTLDPDRDGYCTEDGLLFIPGKRLAELPIKTTYDFDSQDGVEAAADLLEQEAGV